MTFALWFACRAVDPAPSELDDLLHYVWQNVDAGDDETIAAAALNLDAAIDGARFEEASDGSLSRLTREEAELVGVTEDPQLAAGVYLLNHFDCDWDQLREIVSYAQQDELYDGAYDAYAREFEVPRADWLARTAPRTDYDISYTTTLVGTTYTAESRGALRTISDYDEDTAPFGELLVQRSYAPSPAVFEEGSNKSQEQDYQIEVYWRSGGRVVHAYGLWRQADYGSGLTMESTASQRLLLNGLLDWDDETAALCAEGRP